MRTRSTAATLVVASLGLGALVPACVDPLPPGTAVASTPTGASPDAALVTFVRAVSDCDTGEYAIITDTAGRYVGSLGPGTQFSARVAQGPHGFYAWSNVDLHVDMNRAFNDVAVVRLDAVRGESRFVKLEVQSPCRNNRSTFDMQVVAQTGEMWKELEPLLTKTTPLTVDVAAGQAALDAQPAHLQRHLEFGSRKLRSYEQTRLRDERTAQLRKEDESERGGTDSQPGEGTMQ